ncbi:MAG: PRC-barrel domain-containing protein [Limnochordia bacterium]|nr:YlmC/YmxH family sporulation protein [Bacillota bacterium]
MKVIRTSELRRLDVINVEEGRYMGSVCDVDLDPDTGRINALIVDEVKPLSFFFGARHTDVEIPWRDIVLVGEDVVLVKNRTWKR